MSTDLARLTEDLRTVENLDEFWSRIGQELAQFGITSFLFGATASKAETHERGFARSVFIKTNHPQEYFDVFGAEEFMENDLTAHRAVLSLDATFWHDEHQWAEATPAQKNQSNIENEMGLGVGVTIPTESFYPQHVGAVSICSSELNGSEFNRLWASYGETVTQILGLLDTGMRNQHLAEIISLSKREKECLIWLANGLRPPQIAHRLNVGYRTVDKHINNARRKLKATTRDQAVAKALLFDLICP